MPVHFDELQIGNQYDRSFLAKLWNYQGFQAISKGVVTPSGSLVIILFVTKIKQGSLQQYNDYIRDNVLFWEGEDKHGSDQRIINSKSMGDQIHLFYRNEHHTPFTYFGQIHLINYQRHTSRPSEFSFQIGEFSEIPDIVDDLSIFEQKNSNLSQTERLSLEKSRIGQGIFRDSLVKIWGRCAVTGFSNVDLLRASHIKPWRVSTNQERLNPFNGLLLSPNFDLLFDKGFITFNPNGKIIISKKLSIHDQHVLHVRNDHHLHKVLDENKPFLEFHREIVFHE